MNGEQPGTDQIGSGNVLCKGELPIPAEGLVNGANQSVIRR